LCLRQPYGQTLIATWQLTRILRLNASVPCDHLQSLFIQQWEQLLGDKQKVALHQPNGIGGDNGLQDAD